MIVKTYYCDLCKKRVRKNQKVWFQGDGSEYHFNCKYKAETDPIEAAIQLRLSMKLQEFI